MAPLLTLVTACALLLGPSARTDELPRAWRDRSDEELADVFDRLEGKPAPSLAKVEHWSGTEARDWSDLRGKVVLLDLWATWCKPSVERVPELTRMHARHAGDGLVVLGVHSATRFDLDTMRRTAQALGIAYPLAVDTERGLSTALGVRSIPAYFVVDRAGVVRVASAERTKLVAIVEHLLTEDGRALTNGPLQQWPPHVAKKLFARQDLRGKPAPELVVDKWLTDEPATRGKVVVIDFWATWCRPCAKVMPELSAWARELEDEVVIIGVSNENEATVRAFLRKAPAAYSLAIDERKRMYGVVGVQAIPHVLVISSDGIVRWQGYPLDKQDPLTLDLLRRIVALDAGARAPAERK